MEDYAQIAIAIIIFVLIAAGVYAVYVKVIGLFREFRGLKTRREIDRLVGRSGAARYLREFWKKRSGDPRKIQLSYELIHAAKLGDVGRLKELIDSGVHVDATRGAGGRTGLMRASENGHLRAVELLLGSGAQVSQKGGRTGRPALLRACGNGHFDVAKILVDHGADVNSTDALGMTSLMLAAITANYDLVEMLIRRGADPNARDNQGQTALMHVVSRYMPIPFRTIIRVLVQSGADVNVTDARGRTVLDYAIEANLNDLAALLRSYEARSGHRQEQSRSAPTTTGIDEYYSMLDCKPTDSDAEIRRRYHLLVKDYHPDVIQRKGLPEDFVRYATERFQEISEAFQQIVKHRQENRG